jgi:hypothetical protein
MLRRTSRGSSLSSTWFTLKYMFWPGFRARYEGALTAALRRRQADVQARLNAKLAEQRALEEQMRTSASSTLGRGLDLLRKADEQAASRLKREREAALARAQARFEELRPSLIREHRLEMLAEAEKLLKQKAGRVGAPLQAPAPPAGK